MSNFGQVSSTKKNQQNHQTVYDARTNEGRSQAKHILQQSYLQSTASDKEPQGDKEIADKLFYEKEKKILQTFDINIDKIYKHISFPINKNYQPLIDNLKSGFDSGLVSLSAEGSGRGSLLAGLVATRPVSESSNRLKWDAFQTFLEYGARPDAVFKNNRSALHEVAADPLVPDKYLHAMILKGCDVNGRDKFQKSPMDLAIESGNIKLIPLLQSAKAVDNNVLRPFSHVAVEQLIKLKKMDEPQAEQQFLATLKVLHQEGYKLDKKNHEGQTLEDLLKKHFDQEFVNKILAAKKEIEEKSSSPRKEINIIMPSVFKPTVVNKDSSDTIAATSWFGKMADKVINNKIKKQETTTRNALSESINSLFFEKDGTEKEIKGSAPGAKFIKFGRFGYTGAGEGFGSQSAFFNQLGNDPKMRDLWPHIDMSAPMASSKHGDNPLMHAIRLGDQETIRAILSLPPELQTDLNKMNAKGETAALLAAQNGDIGTLRLLVGVQAPDGTMVHAPEAPDNMRLSGNIANRNMIFQNGHDLLQEAAKWSKFTGGDINAVDGSVITKEIHSPNPAILDQMVAELGFVSPDWMDKTKSKPVEDVESGFKPNPILLNPNLPDVELRAPTNEDELKFLARQMAAHTQVWEAKIAGDSAALRKLPSGPEKEDLYATIQKNQEKIDDNLVRAKSPDVVIAAFQIAIREGQLDGAKKLLDTISKNLNNPDFKDNPLNNPWSMALLPDVKQLDFNDKDYHQKINNPKSMLKYMSPLDTSVVDLATADYKMGSTAEARQKLIDQMMDMDRSIKSVVNSHMGPDGDVGKAVGLATTNPAVQREIQEQSDAFNSNSGPSSK